MQVYVALSAQGNATRKALLNRILTKLGGEAARFVRSKHTTQWGSIPIPIPTPTPTPGGTKSRRIANHWLQATAKTAPEPHVQARRLPPVQGAGANIGRAMHLSKTWKDLYAMTSKNSARAVAHCLREHEPRAPAQHTNPLPNHPCARTQQAA